MLAHLPAWQVTLATLILPPRVFLPTEPSANRPLRILVSGLLDIPSPT